MLLGALYDGMAVTELWTIGYEKVGVPDFVAALKAAKIKTLVDVREVANSRRAGFSKKSLAASLDEAGIAYMHMKPLGTPKAGREAARKGDAKTMQRIFEAKLAEPESQLALAEVAELARQRAHVPDVPGARLARLPPRDRGQASGSGFRHHADAPRARTVSLIATTRSATQNAPNTMLISWGTWMRPK